MSAELVEHVFKPAFSNAALDRMSDSAVAQVPAWRLANSTDSFVVRPLFFPGGSTGALAAMRAHPLGRDAAIIGEVTDAHPGMLIGRTGIGASRAITMQIGEQLPRIC